MSLVTLALLLLQVGDAIKQKYFLLSIQVWHTVETYPILVLRPTMMLEPYSRCSLLSKGMAGATWPKRLFSEVRFVSTIITSLTQAIFNPNSNRSRFAGLHYPNHTP